MKIYISGLGFFSILLFFSLSGFIKVENPHSLLSELDSVVTRQIAFPGAEGFGKYTTGGRGGAVYVVDNLLDSVKNPPKGSLRWAIKQNGPRTIVFAVSGTIELQGPLKINKGNLTIAGQTAPGDGICLKNYTTSISADNVIIRYLRFRCGNEKLKNDSQDGMNGVGNNNIIIDHCSISWSIDEAGSFYDNRNFTLQWSIISESLFNTGHSKGEHGYGGIWGGMGASFHHNLIADHTSRNPRFCGARYHKNAEYHELVDFRNNVIFNWGFNSIYGGEDGWHNIVGNYYKPGPGTKRHKDRILNPDGVGSKWYVADNFIEGSSKISANNWDGGVQDADTALNIIKSDTAFTVIAINTQKPQDVFQSVLSEAGAKLPKRDVIDERIISEAKNGTCKFGGEWGVNTGIIDSPLTVGGWPQLKTYNVKKDSDKDGMPDEWEKANKLDPKNPEDRNGDSDKDGYTNLEEYVNSIGS